MNTQNRSSELATNALATLANALDSGDSQTLLNYLAVMARFHTYSWTNSLLITLQRPTASRVAGFHAWLKLRRHVRRSEKGIAILAPVICTLKAQQELSEPPPQEDAHPVRRLVGFRTA
jgi:hypothetical protein